MTMIISAHLGDCILISADKRAMVCDLETGTMRVSHNDESKIGLWCRGAIAGTGDIIFVNRVMNYFKNLSPSDLNLYQMNIIHEEIERRLIEGIPKDVLINTTLIFSIYNGCKSNLYTIPIEQFFNKIDIKAIPIIHSRIYEVKEWTIDICCFNPPPDISNFQNFQRNLRSLSSFDKEIDFITYYIEKLKQLFAIQSLIDPSITPSFDLYFQSCETGHSLALHVKNIF